MASEEILARVCSVWADVLDLPEVGPDDNFFQLGGRSLTAVQIVRGTLDAFAVSLPVQTVFEAPTPRAFVDRVTAGAEGGGFAGPAARTADTAPLSWQQEWQYRLEQAVSGSNIYSSFVRFELRGPVDRAAFDGAWLDVVERHAVLRTRYRVVGGAVEQVVDGDAHYDLEEHDLSAWDEATRGLQHRKVHEEFTRRGYDLARDAGLRVQLVLLEPDRAQVVVSVHHINFDGWSRDILLAGFVAAYRARLGLGEAPAAPQAQYADFARWQRMRLSEAAEDHLRFWRDAVGPGAPRLCPREESARATYLSARHELALPAESARGLIRLAQEEGTTPFAACLAVFGAVLADRLGVARLPVATITANRTWAATNDVIGMFLTILPVAFELDGRADVREAVRRTGASVVRTMSHQEYPLEHAYLTQEPVATRALVEGLRYGIALHPALRPERELVPGLGLLQLPPRLETGPGDEADEVDPSTFDVTLELRESPDGIVGHLTHQVDAVPHAEAAALVRSFAALATLAQRDPCAVLADLAARARSAADD
ncbi:condensation domain-containing protein [Streptomyces sp. NPDC049687]|uniref:condensation domain-containing protein n=1 Tax=Streptomyces sp. NPDC049687 TaxID=3365596 RepID=UPI0037AEE159